MAELLIEKEVIFAEDVEAIFGKRPWASRSEEIMAESQVENEVKSIENKEENSNNESEKNNENEKSND